MYHSSNSNSYFKIIGILRNNINFKRKTQIMEIHILIIQSFFIFFGLVGFISLIYKICKNGIKDKLEEMFKNGDIDKETYFKYTEQ